MPITINGSGSLSGLNAGGLPDATVTPPDLTQPLTLETAKASTSGTSVDFTGIPSWVKRITVMFNGVSTSSTSPIQVQIGSGGFSVSGYTSCTSFGAGSSNQYNSSTVGFVLDPPSFSNTSSNVRSGALVLTLIGSNTWVASGCIAVVAQVLTAAVAGNSPALSGAMDRLRIIGSSTGSPTDTFDLGSINIMYE
jgi:hypothetical protein